MDGQRAEGTVGSWGPRTAGGGAAPLETLAAPLGLTPVACVAVCPPCARPCVAWGTVPEDEPCLEAQLALLCGRAWTPQPRGMPCSLDRVSHVPTRSCHVVPV